MFRKKYLEELKYDDGIFKVIKNTFVNDGSLHSLMYINIAVASKGYSSSLWFIDDSSQTNKYNKKLLTITTRDFFGYRQIIMWGILYDSSSKSFDALLEPLAKILGYHPKIILSDRCKSQIKSLETNFNTSKIMYCYIHIIRNLGKFYKNNHPVLKSYLLMMQGRLNEDLMFEVWNAFIGEESKYMEEEFEEDSDTYIDDKEYYEQEQPDIFFNTKEYSSYCQEDIKNVKEMVNEALKITDKKGVGTLLQLMKEKDRWVLSKYINSGLYRNISTNPVEGWFGSLKQKIKNKSLHLFELMDTIKDMVIDSMTRSYSIDIPKTVIDTSDERYKNLTEISKLVILEQLTLLESDKFNPKSKSCLSCKIRSINNDNSFPCSHYFYHKYGKNVFIRYEDLSSVCFKKDPILIPDRNYSRNDFIKPENVSVLNNVAYVKVYKNKNDNARKNVDQRRKRFRNLVTQTMGFETELSMVNSNPLHNQTIKNGYICEAGINISFVKSLDEQKLILETIKFNMKTNTMEQLSLIHKENKTNTVEKEKCIIQDDDNNIPNESNDMEEIDIYSENILNEYNISKECYNDLMSFEFSDSKCLIDPTIIDCLNKGILYEFRDYISRDNKQEKIYFPLKYNGFWNLMIVFKKFKYKKKIFNKCVINISYKNNILGIDIETKIKRYLYVTLKKQYDDIIHIKLDTHEALFKDDTLFVKTLRNIYSSTYEDDEALKHLIKSPL